MRKTKQRVIADMADELGRQHQRIEIMGFVVHRALRLLGDAPAAYTLRPLDAILHDAACSARDGQVILHDLACKSEHPGG